MSSFFRKRVRGLLKNTFSVPTSVVENSSQEYEINDENEVPFSSKLCEADLPPRSSSAQIYQQILNGRSRENSTKPPEIYSGKTGLDLPVIHMDKFLPSIKACYTGPEGGLTEVQQMRQQKVARMANLDDELSLSSFEDDENVEGNGSIKNLKVPTTTAAERRTNSIEALGFTDDDLQVPGTSTSNYDWSSWDGDRAFGLSTSLYEKNPITGMNAGAPIADVFGIIARENSAILALADGVNWGERARLAARCAIRGAIDHLNIAIDTSSLETTKDVFHCLLGAFHASHALILQEGGALTTLCVAIVAPVKNSDSSVLCVCNVGDSLCFIYNTDYGVIEVTQASHDIGQMRDMRDAGGALGPVDGRNPQLHNLTCSMTFLEEGDLVFITSDGISDNFDPVVGKFCSIRKSEVVDLNLSHVEMDPFTGAAVGGTPQRPTGGHQNVPLSVHKTKSAPVNNGIISNAAGVEKQIYPIPVHKAPMASIPCVDSFERHELMLLRMADVIANGSNSKLSVDDEEEEPFSFQSGNESNSSDERGPVGRMVTASELCKNLIQFAYQLSAAKRSTLEDPELYRTRTHSKTEERLKRKMIRNMITEMPGKLDHASGKWRTCDPDAYSVQKVKSPEHSLLNWKINNANSVSSSSDAYNGNDYESIRLDTDINVACRDTSMTLEIVATQKLMKRVPAMGVRKCKLNLDPFPLAVTSAAYCHFNPAQDSPVKSPYEGSYIPRSFKTPEQCKYADQTIGANRIRPSSKKRHARGSHARHTLGVDVTWLKRLVVNRNINDENNKIDDVHEQSPKYNKYVEVLETVKPRVNGIRQLPVKDLSNSPNGLLNGHRSDFSNRSPSNNFALKKLRTFIKQTRNVVNNSLTAKPCHSTPPLPRSSVILGISALKTPPNTSRLPASTRV